MDPAGSLRPGSPERPARAMGAGAMPAEPRTPLFRWIGSLPTRGGLSIMLGAALIGVIGTLLAGSEPGSLLVWVTIIGSVVAALSIRRDSMYLLIPLPALLLFAAALFTGYVHDKALFHGLTKGAVFLQWISGVFFGMCAATILVVVISGGRWVLSKALVSGQFGASAGQVGGRGRRAAGPGQPGTRADRRVGGASRDNAPWDAADPWDGSNSPAGQRAAQGDGRDPWGDTRQPGDRGYPAGQRPGGQQPPGQPGAQRPGGPQPPGQPGAQRPGGQQSGGEPDDRGYPGIPRPGTQPTDRGFPGQPPDRGYPGGQRSGADGWPGDAPPPARDQRAQRDQPDDRDPWGTRSQRVNRDQRDSDDPWAQRLPDRRVEHARERG
jgi:uncharacterized protein DUF6542